MNKLSVLAAVALVALAATLSACARPAHTAGSAREKGTSAQPNASKDGVAGEKGEAVRDQVYAQGNEKLKEVYLAGGCFWGVQTFFDRVPGIVKTEVGYANGDSNQTSYREVDRTGHSEAVHITYDANKIHLAEILDRLYLIIDPLSLNKQGNDVGTQYRTGIYWTDPTQEKIVHASLEQLDRRLGAKNVIEAQPLKNFVRAEEYHQDYLQKNPGGYCHINPRLADKMLYPGTEKPAEDQLKQSLSGEQYNVTQNKGTEAPFSSEYETVYEQGIYVDVVNGQPLFSSVDKFDSGCGWPSFTQPITTDALSYKEDRSHGMNRIEVESTGAQSHDGHVFNDGPNEAGGLRYCINGAALRFIPLAEMQKQGYGDLIPYTIGG